GGGASSTAERSATGAGPREGRLRAAISHRLASLAEDLGDLAEARTQAEASLALWRELDDPEGTADALNLLGKLAIDARELDDARARFEDALQLLAAGDHPRRGRVLHNLGLLAARRGDAHE